MRKHLFCIGKYLLIYLAAVLLYFALDAVILHVIYPVLNEFFPSVFLTYNPVTEKEKYIALRESISLWAALISVSCANAVDLIHDNARLELLVSRTDGFYTLREGFKIYLPSFISVDVISSLLAPAVFIPLTLISLPDRLARIEAIIDTPLMMTSSVCTKVGEVWAYFLILLASLVGRCVGVWLGLDRWRGLWLSDVGSEVK